MVYANLIHRPIRVISNAIVESRKSHLSHGSSTGNSTTGSLIFSVFSSMGIIATDPDRLSVRLESAWPVKDKEKDTGMSMKMIQ